MPEQIDLGTLGVGVIDRLELMEGMVNEDTVEEYASTGVDIVSMGCLTSGVKSIDMSMKLA